MIWHDMTWHDIVVICNVVSSTDVVSFLFNVLSFELDHIHHYQVCSDFQYLLQHI